MPGRKHGEAQNMTPEYKSWQSMRQRCTNPSDDHYKNYGARGITVCAQWLSSYEAFLADMGRRPTRGHSLDRKEVDGNYEPLNCRWSSSEEQQNNRRNNRQFEFRGKSQTLSRWAREVGIPRPTLFSRIVERGWSVDMALTLPQQRGLHAR